MEREKMSETKTEREWGRMCVCRRGGERKRE